MLAAADGAFKGEHMNEQHTPGPWKMGPNFSHEEAIIGKDGKVVADASWTGGSGCELSIDNPADANLITAAPELFEFVKEWLDRQGTDENYMVMKARAALAKARGETK
jgi:hypothetical protein